MPITLVVAANNERLLQNNLLASPGLSEIRQFDQLLVQENFASAANAYNDALEKSHNDLVVFAHQDVYLPERWISDLMLALSYLERSDPQWGVLGCYGVTANGLRYGRVYSAGLGVIGAAIEHPTRVQTLDEIVLVLRKSSGLGFDSQLPGFHFYGSDICLRAAARKMNSYAMPAFCVHNTQMNPTLPPEFYHCYRHFKKQWRRSLPVHTSCITVSRFDLPFYARRLRETYIAHVRGTKAKSTRLPSPREVLEGLPEQ